MPSILTPLQITATANLLQNQGISSYTISNAVTTYTTTSLVAPLANTVAVGSTGNILSANTLVQVVTIAANTCPALSDSIPSASANSFPKELISTLISNTANIYLGNGDLTKFAQALAVSQGYIGITNQFINSAVNSQTYLDNTFTNYNDMISGGITAVNVCTTQWASDLTNLGGLINLKNLDELGTPLALVKQLASFGGITPQISIAFTAAGVSLDTVVNLTSSTLTASDIDQQAMYAAMTNITGTDLTEILQILGVTTANINTMADLLNPYKIFPNSFQSLTVTNVNNVSENIYLNTTGAVNLALVQGLPTVAVSTLS
jgi:hypothetical protein